MVAIETKIIEGDVKKGITPKVIAKEHNIPEDIAKWIVEGIKSGKLCSDTQEYVLI